jgi:UDP-glucose 4-epimerase
MAKPTESARVVAVTGASGYIAGRLIRHLCAEESVERVLGFDNVEPDLAHPKFVFDRIDVRNPSIESRLKGIDVVVHLAFIMEPVKDEGSMRDVNVNGSQNIFRSAARAGVKRIVYTSSATVYGAHPDNEVPLTEDSPLRANLDFSYPAHKLEVEYVIKEFRGEFPDVAVTVFRPAIVYGPHVDNAWSHILEMPVVWSVKGFRPPFQFVHEEDVAAALLFAVENEMDGPYNLAPNDWMSSDDILAVVGRRRVELPEPAAFSLAERLWSMNMSEAPAGMLHYVMYPWVVSPEKLQSAGFKCVFSTSDALNATVAHTKGLVRVGKARMSTSDLRRGAVAAAGLLGVALAARTLRRRR